MPANSPSTVSFWKRWSGGVLVLIATALIWSLCFRFPSVWVMTGIGEPNRPFLDLYALLAACDAQRMGLNPLLPNPLDPYNRPFGFSSWWFEISKLGWGRKDVLWLGVTLLGIFLATVVAVTRPKNWRDCMGLSVLLMSPAVLMSVNRANQDLVVFLVVSLGLLSFRVPHVAWRSLGVIFFAAAAVLKFFPLVTLVLLLEFRTRKGVLVGTVIYFLVLFLAWPTMGPALQLAGRHSPAPEWLYAFGAPTIARDLGGSDGWTWRLLAVLIFGGVIWEAFSSAGRSTSAVSEDDRSIDREFVCGAAMLVGVFFLGVSYVYKLVFAVWLLPWLWRRRSGHAETLWARIIGSLLITVGWLEGAFAVLLNSVTFAANEQVLKVVVVMAQVFEWTLIACLLRFLCLHILRRGRELTTGVPVATGSL